MYSKAQYYLSRGPVDGEVKSFIILVLPFQLFCWGVSNPLMLDPIQSTTSASLLKVSMSKIEPYLSASKFGRLYLNHVLGSMIYGFVNTTFRGSPLIVLRSRRVAILQLALTFFFMFLKHLRRATTTTSTPSQTPRDHLAQIFHHVW